MGFDRVGFGTNVCFPFDQAQKHFLKRIMTLKIVEFLPRGACAGKGKNWGPLCTSGLSKTKSTHPSPKTAKREVCSGSGSHRGKEIGPGLDASPTLRSGMEPVTIKAHAPMSSTSGRLRAGAARRPWGLLARHRLGSRGFHFGRAWAAARGFARS